MEIFHTARIESRIGDMRIASTSAGLAYLELPFAAGRGLEGWLRRHAPDAKLVEGYAPNRPAIAQIVEFVEGKRKKFELDLDLRGTAFELCVYEYLLAIPYGETRSYEDVARTIGRPKAVRAVGTANGSNPIALVVPCHRIINKSGKLGGYGGGLTLKRQLLAMEREHSSGDRLL